MSRKKLKLLANVARAGLAAVTVLALGTALLWSWLPARVDAFEAWLHERLTAPVRSAAALALGEPDPARQATLLLALHDRLGDVRRDDHLAGIALDCRRRLGALARARGDLTAAIGWLQAAVAFDDRDLLLVAELGALECEHEDTRQAGLDRLAQLDARFPAHPAILPVLAAQLVAGGRAREALRRLDAAAALPQSNLWVVQWDAGGGIEASARGVETMPAVAGDRLRLRFSMPAEWRRLRFCMPTFSACTLAAPRLSIACAGQRTTIDVATAGEGFHDLLVAGDGIEAFGASGPRFEVPLPVAGPGPADVVLEARVRWRRSSLLARPMSAAALAELAAALEQEGATAALASLQEWRLLALHGGLELFFAAPGQAFDAARRRTAPAALASGAHARAFDATFAVPAGTAAARFDLLPFAGYRWRVHSIEATVGDGGSALDPALLVDAPGNHVERQPDGSLRTTGSDPWITVPVPADATSLRIRGDVR